MRYICKECSYDLSGLTTGETIKCPECGCDFDPSAMQPFPSFGSYLKTNSVDWFFGLLCMFPVSLVFTLIQRFAGYRVFGVTFVILTVGLLLIAIRSRVRVVRLQELSFTVPKYAERVSGLLIFAWCLVYWVVVFMPWMVLG